MTDNLKSLIQQAIGEASMCWNPIPAGVFDSKAAGKVADKLLKEVNSVLKPACAAAASESAKPSVNSAYPAHRLAQIAHKIVKEIRCDMDDRAGGDEFFGGCDEETAREIEETWAAIIVRNIG